jgi:Putative beta-barrel porin-2, OmpL-like. bbp2
MVQLQLINNLFYKDIFMYKYSFMMAVALSQLLFTTSLVQAEPVAFPDISLSLNKNENPYKINADILGDVHIGGVLTGLAMAQTNELSSDDEHNLDLSNGQLFIQKNSGLVQFYAQAGGYSIPSLGLPYVNADDSIDNLFGVLPVAYVTVAPHENFSISVGKLPTLIGAEYTFTFQNLNIQRGLLWNQENAVNRGVQLDYMNGDFSAAISFNDGFYSDRFNWVSGLVSYNFTENHNAYITGGANLGDTRKATFATPLLQNNDNIATIAYTYTDDKWLISPYVQYNYVKEDREIGINDEGSTLGFAVLANYKYTDNYSLAARGEYISSSGGSAMLYGSDSDAWSITLTPTYKQGAFFARADLAYVGLQDAAAGAGFGKNGDEDGQARLVLETGLLF